MTSGEEKLRTINEKMKLGINENIPNESCTKLMNYCNNVRVLWEECSLIGEIGLGLIVAKENDIVSKIAVLWRDIKARYEDKIKVYANDLLKSLPLEFQKHYVRKPPALTNRLLPDFQKISEILIHV